jgi:hypothetical protein
LTKLKDEFTRKEWKGCCGKGCKKCAIAQAYIDKYGRAEGLEKLSVDRAKMQKASRKTHKKGKKKVKA